MSDPSVDDLTAASDLVFRGSVRQVGATSLAEVRPSDLTAVVRVDEVILPEDPLPGLVGSDVTVALASPQGVDEGSRFVFFVRSWLFGSGIAVREVGRTPEPQGAGAAMAAPARDALARLADSDLRRRIGASEVVVLGRVADVGPSREYLAASAANPGPVSEHDPQWQEATVIVESTVKGETADRVSVLFPGSLDVHWRAAPRLAPGEEALLVLHREPVPGVVAAARADVYAVVDRLDRLDPGRLDQVRSLTDEPGAGRP